MAMIIEDVSYLTAIEAAEILNTTSMRVLMLIKQQALTGILQDGQWLVKSDSVLAWKTAPPEQKEQKVCASSCTGCNCS